MIEYIEDNNFKIENVFISSRLYLYYRLYVTLNGLDVCILFSEPVTYSKKSRDKFIKKSIYHPKIKRVRIYEIKIGSVSN